jgi:hypothetical protein
VVSTEIVRYFTNILPSLPALWYLASLYTSQSRSSIKSIKIMSHVSDLQLQDLPGVQPHLISKLRQAGIQSVLDLAVSVPQELAAGGEGSAISADTETISELVLKAKKALADSGALVKEFSTADQVLERRSRFHSIHICNHFFTCCVL